MDNMEELLEADYKHADNLIRYHNESMMKPYLGPHPYLHNLEGNLNHHTLLAKKIRAEIQLYKLKHELGIYNGELQKG